MTLHFFGLTLTLRKRVRTRKEIEGLARQAAIEKEFEKIRSLYFMMRNGNQI